MIRVRKNHRNPPAILTSDKCKERIEQAMREKHEHRLCTQCCGKEVKAALRELYHNKCAYCESPVRAKAIMEIEHYRPRNKITGEEKHSGYYWLSYEWSNLLSSCKGCNSTKRNRFPIDSTGKRAPEPEFENGTFNKKEWWAGSKTLKAEKPLLLHPEIDDPAKHIIFLPDGRVKGIDKRGQCTIEVCQLNRDDLVWERKKIIDKFLKEIVKLLIALMERSKDIRAFYELFDYLLIDILLALEPAQPFSRLAWFMFKRFDLFFVQPLREQHPLLAEKYQGVVRKAYDSFRKKISITL
jgi:uncharacterized protein (TIGR02646 family)